MFRVDFNKLRFLVCDDNPHMRRILRTLLHSFGTREVYEDPRTAPPRWKCTATTPPTS